MAAGRHSDPEAEAWDAMAQWQRGRNDAQAAEAERRYRAARKVADGADHAGKAVTGAELGSASYAVVSGQPRALKAAKAVGRAAGPIGRILSATEAGAEFQADRAKGMPLDEAIIKNGGGLALGLGLGGLGAAGGGAAGTAVLPGGGTLVGAGAGGYAGAEAGESLGERLQLSVADLKARARDAARQVTDPNYYLRLRRGY
jgi:hypothetical protein